MNDLKFDCNIINFSKKDENFAKAKANEMTN